MKSFESVGKNIEEAVQNGLRALNLTKADVDIKILNKGGWFSKARVLITSTVEDVNEDDTKLNNSDTDLAKKAEKAEKINQNQEKNDKNFANAKELGSKTISDKSENTNEDLSIKNSTFSSQNVLEADKTQKKEPKHLIVKDVNQGNVNACIQFLQGLFQAMKTEASIEVFEDEMSVILQVKTANSGVLIGKHGDTMQAIQSILNTFISSKNSGYKKILIDVENYRKKQVEKIENKARDAIETCVQKAKPVSLDYMNSYERHIVHELVIQDGRVVSESFGKEPRRFVKIFIK